MGQHFSLLGYLDAILFFTGKGIQLLKACFHALPAEAANLPYRNSLMEGLLVGEFLRSIGILFFCEHNLFIFSLGSIAENNFFQRLLHYFIQFFL